MIMTGLIFIMLFMTSVTAIENGDPNKPNDGSDTSEGDGKQEKGSEMFGKFGIEGQKITGDFVGFEMAEGKVLNYTFQGEKVFSEIQFGHTCWTQNEYKMNGAEFEAEKEGLQILSHNNPSSTLMIRSEGNNTIEITPGEGVTFRNNGNGSFSIEGLTVDSRIQLRNATSTINGSSLRIVLKNGSSLMYMIMSNEGEYQFQHSYYNAVLEGKVDGEIQINNGSTDLNYQHFSYMGKVDMRVSGQDTGKMVRIQVESLEKKGKVVAIMLDDEVLANRSLDRIRVSFDNEVMESSEDPDVVIEASGDTPIYCIDRTEDGQYQALVYVPEFSVHEIEFTTNDIEEVPGFSMVSILASIALISFVLLIIRKRN